MVQDVLLPASALRRGWLFSAVDDRGFRFSDTAKAAAWSVLRGAVIFRDLNPNFTAGPPYIGNEPLHTQVPPAKSKTSSEEQLMKALSFRTFMSNRVLSRFGCNPNLDEHLPLTAARASPWLRRTTLPPTGRSAIQAQQQLSPAANTHSWTRT